MEWNEDSCLPEFVRSTPISRTLQLLYLATGDAVGH